MVYLLQRTFGKETEVKAKKKIFAVIGIGVICLIAFFSLFQKGKSAKPVAQKMTESVVTSLPEADSCPNRTHVVSKGESLWKIAEKYYGNRGFWYPLIFEANKDKIQNAKLIYPDQEFSIPAKKPGETACLFDLSKIEKIKASGEKPVKSAIPPSEPEEKKKADESKTPQKTLVFSEPVKIPIQVKEEENSPLLTSSVFTLPKVFEKQPLSIPATLLESEGVNKEAIPSQSEAKKAVGNYEVVLRIPSDQIQGIHAGIFPALYLENKNDKGEWKRREKTSVVIIEDGSNHICTIVLRKSPPANSALGIDFENSYSLEVNTEFLSQGEISAKDLPKPLKKKRYTSLYGVYQGKHNLGLRTLRFIAPTIIRSGVSFMTMGPIGLIYAPISIATDIGMKKITSDHPKTIQESTSGGENK